MTRREFLWSLPATIGAAGCLGLDPRAATDALAASAFSECSGSFGFDLFRQLHMEPGNLVVSPFNVSASLALASAAAGGETLSEFRRVIQWADHHHEIHPAASNWQRRIAASLSSSRCEMRAAYGLWTAKSIHVKSEFRSIAEKHYDGAWQSTDFGEPDAAVRTINQWAELHTAAKIRDLVRPSDAPATTRILLAGGTYFKGLWAQSFPIAATTYAAFQSPRGTKLTAAYMQHTARHRYAENDDWQMLELALAGRVLAMLILIPRTTNALSALEPKLDARLFHRLLDDLQPQTVVVTLPRFRIATSLRLQKPLEELGLNRAFRNGEADFSGLANDQSLSLSGVVQKTAIEVNEEGLETFTATGAAARARDRLTDADNARAFVANQPFLFAVRDVASDSVLFLGRVEKP